MKWTLPSLLIAALFATGAGAQSNMRATDAARLAAFDTVLESALAQARTIENPDTLAALERALAGTPDVAFVETLAGNWTCRTMKLGGPERLQVFSNFRCRFRITTQGFDFEKLSGSERTKGSILLREGRAIYLGMGFAAGQTPPAYAALPDDFQSTETLQTHVAVFERINTKRARLMFPNPASTSALDILEMTR